MKSREAGNAKSRKSKKAEIREAAKHRTKNQKKKTCREKKKTKQNSPPFIQNLWHRYPPLWVGEPSNQPFPFETWTNSDDLLGTGDVAASLFRSVQHTQPFLAN